MGGVYDAEGLDLVFAGDLGSPLDQRNLAKRVFKPALQRAGLDPKIRIYDLRHTCATLLLTAGLPIHVISERLGHARTSITLDLYIERVPNMQAEAAARMQQILGS